MGKHRDEIWQELCDLDNRVTRLEDRAILKPEYDPADVAFNRAKPWEWQVPTAAPVDELAALRAENARLVAERDALRARIDGGTVATGWAIDQTGWAMTTRIDKHYTHIARIIDIAPLSDAGDVVDERKGERRKGGWEYCGCRKDLCTFCPGSTDFCWRPINESPMRAARDNRRDAANTNDRRTNPTGTRAMRGQA